MCQEGCSVSLWGLGSISMDAIQSYITDHNGANNDLLSQTPEIVISWIGTCNLIVYILLVLLVSHLSITL